MNNMPKKKSKKFRTEIRSRVIKYVGAGFGLVAAFAWNDAIKSLIQFLFPLEKNSVLAKFVYAIIMTLVVVVVTTYIVKFFRKEEPDQLL
jgi:hypothetical protein